jgi:hypothetical protein
MRIRTLAGPCAQCSPGVRVGGKRRRAVHGLVMRFTRRRGLRAGLGSAADDRSTSAGGRSVPPSSCRRRACRCRATHGRPQIRPGGLPPGGERDLAVAMSTTSSPPSRSTVGLALGRPTAAARPAGPVPGHPPDAGRSGAGRRASSAPRAWGRTRVFVALLVVPLMASLGANSASGAQPVWPSPVLPLHVLRAFDPPAHDWLPGHRGVDLETHLGQDVRAAGGGVITYAAELAGRGVVVVDHGDLRTTYQPVATAVQVGQRVQAGDVIGTIAAGSGHCGSGGCLHLGLRQSEVYLDPMLILGGATAVLRP